MHITDHLLMTEYLFISSSYVFCFEWFNMLWECYFKFYKSSLKCEGNKIMKNNKKFSNLQDMFIFLGSLLLSNIITFLFLIHFQQLKCCRSATWSFTNHFRTLIAIDQHRRNFLDVWEPAFVSFSGVFL